MESVLSLEQVKTMDPQRLSDLVVAGHIRVSKEALEWITAEQSRALDKLQRENAYRRFVIDYIQTRIAKGQLPPVSSVN